MELREKISELAEAISAEVLTTKEKLEAYRVKYLGSKGALKNLYEQLKSVPNESKREFGALINQLKNKAEEKFNLGQSTVTDAPQETGSTLDLTRPAYESELGARHPLSVVRNEIIEIVAVPACRLDDDSTILRAQIHRLVDFEAGFRQKRSGDAHCGAVAPFPHDHRCHPLFKQSRYDATSTAIHSSMRRSTD